jgi:hypothetical protein
MPRLPGLGGLFFRVSVYPSSMNRRSCLLIASSFVLLMLGCTGVREFPQSHAAAPAPSAQPIGGQAVIAIPTDQTLFGPALDHASVQPGTLRLKSLISRHPRLRVTALPSSLSTVALGLQEKASGKQRWGGVMIPQERRVFLLFAQDPSLGDWLIMITDVEIRKGPDPIPIVAYRWARADVEAYAKCGIPQSLIIDPCTDAFYRAPEVTIVHYKSPKAGQ